MSSTGKKQLRKTNASDLISCSFKNDLQKSVKKLKNVSICDSGVKNSSNVRSSERLDHKQQEKHLSGSDKLDTPDYLSDETNDENEILNSTQPVPNDQNDVQPSTSKPKKPHQLQRIRDLMKNNSSTGIFDSSLIINQAKSQLSFFEKRSILLGTVCE